MEANLGGRVAIITGGSKGIGLAVAARMSQSGADVAILARNRESLDEARQHVSKFAQGRIHVVSCDVTKADQLSAAYSEVMSAFGKIDIVVNNAGMSQTGPFVSISDDVWQADLDLKLFAAIRLTRLVWPQMVDRRWGRVINVLNIGAKAPKAASAPTSVSRAAGMALTKVLAGEGAPFNVLVNALHVGLIDSDQWVRKHARSERGTYEEFLSEMGKNVPLGRVGTAEEFANVACFLASDLASFVTGTSINVDGNMSPVM
ncbi:SDR family oxidoreductase [Caballeronia sp. LZ001]|uniref:SDR family oxidoreductase n=1 Tax=Caballeronia sp. LZ001 TaxID=3038553 RepID=UPI00285D2A98|nr:SDR family oxidoreductase [Caballeronia sp. LZ001]MDR5798858.1 SDR family oxidoreductase [Caballeronia sp. LZ001]